MFDEQPPKNSNEPEDMFAPLDGQIQPGEIKSALANQKLKPVSPAGGLPPEPPSLEAGAPISPPLLSKKGLYIVLAIVVVVALGAGTAWVLLRLPKTPKLENLPSTTEVLPPPVVMPALPNASLGRPEAGTIQLAPEVPPAPPALIDTDADGLTDEEETAQGTDPRLADTDGDALTDYEEIMIWKTEPLKSDTDGDTYPDGTEVKGGYNPNGTGKLLEIPR